MQRQHGDDVAAVTVQSRWDADAGTPEVMQALLLRLRLQLWRRTGHGFSALADALLGTGEVASRKQEDSATLRVATAACMRDVCIEDIGKGLQLLEGIQVILLV